MDVLYSVGPDNGSDWFNLRMSLRSVAVYAKNVDRIIIAGDVPPWVSDKVVAYHHPKDYKIGKHWNILYTILDAIADRVVKGEFLYSSDDHFLVREVDFNNFPYYYKRDVIRGFDEVIWDEGITGWGGYNKSIGLTRHLLEKNGYGIRQYNGHVNTHLDTRDAMDVRYLINSEGKPTVGYEPTLLFMNVRDRRCPVVPTFREDCKIGTFTTMENLMAEIGDRDTFSVIDALDMGSCEGRYREIMQEMYPEKSPFEK